ncbi:hypothetical protein WR25_12276 [Diploscapter pachys]|uniref:Autophagy-related protein 101 n=1 Tax=Diploscapter pachys TaxID=2018661 RepID=A0A2A2JV84_9BILA|nr:hypothetical protein WR25_12276 [Diploscapter pachys]
MNARQSDYRLTVEIRQVSDAVSCIFSSLLLHRTLGKFQYKNETNFSLGSIGIEEVDCDTIDLSYVRVNSPELTMKLSENVIAFREDLDREYQSGSSRRTPVGSPSPSETAVPMICAQIGLEFYQKSPKRGIFYQTNDHATWEKWNLILDIFKVNSIDDFGRLRESVGESIGEIVLKICSQINRNQYMPKMPNKGAIGDVFETQFSDCQPYLFKVVKQPGTCGSSVTPQTLSFYKLGRMLKDVAFS